MSVGIPDVPAGAVLTFLDGEWRYGTGELRLRVSAVREELAPHYGGEWVWIEGDRLDDTGAAVCRKQALVKTTALVLAMVQHPRRKET